MASHAHHILPRSTCPEGVKEPLNIIPLCDDCHRGFHDRFVILYRSILCLEELAWVLGHGDPVWLDEWYPSRGTYLPY
jgi:predicted HNH restriction endonuclease